MSLREACACLYVSLGFVKEMYGSLHVLCAAGQPRWRW